MLEDSGFSAVEIGPPVDTFGGAKDEDKARAFDVYGYGFLACKPIGVGAAERAEPPSRPPGRSHGLFMGWLSHHDTCDTWRPRRRPVRAA